MPRVSRSSSLRATYLAIAWCSDSRPPTPLRNASIALVFYSAIRQKAADGDYQSHYDYDYDYYSSSEYQYLPFAFAFVFNDSNYDYVYDFPSVLI